MALPAALCLDSDVHSALLLSQLVSLYLSYACVISGPSRSKHKQQWKICSSYNFLQVIQTKHAATKSQTQSNTYKKYTIMSSLRRFHMFPDAVPQQRLFLRGKAPTRMPVSLGVIILGQIILGQLAMLRYGVHARVQAALVGQRHRLCWERKYFSGNPCII